VQSQVNFLSYTINEFGIKLLTKRIDAILNYARPETISQLGRFLGIINYYRRCLARSSHIQAPLTELLKDVKKNYQRKIEWTSELHAAFEACKQSIADAALLSFRAEKNYSTYDRELLAIFESIKYFKHLVDGRIFVIRADHMPLVYAFQQRPEKASPRQLRHLAYISQFCTTIMHVK